MRALATTRLCVWSATTCIRSRRMFSSIRQHGVGSGDGENNDGPTKGKTMALVETMRQTLDSDTSLHKSESWDQLWQQGVTPWDLTIPTPLLQVELKEQLQLSSPMTALVPGCGSGFDLITMAQLLPRDSLIVGLDISLTSLQRAQETLQVLLDANANTNNNANKVVLAQGDFFDRTTWKSIFSTDGTSKSAIHHDATTTTTTTTTTTDIIPVSFDFIYDYTFYCALSPSLRPAWGAAMAALLQPSTGRLLTVIFPILPTNNSNKNANPIEGPPFPVTVHDYCQVLEPRGIILQQPPHISPYTVPSRSGKELVAWWILQQQQKHKHKQQHKQRDDHSNDNDNDNQNGGDTPPAKL
jgi:methyl halide transferase